jgi:hypothetical protein
MITSRIKHHFGRLASLFKAISSVMGNRDQQHPPQKRLAKCNMGNMIDFSQNL